MPASALSTPAKMPLIPVMRPSSASIASALRPISNPPAMASAGSCAGCRTFPGQCGHRDVVCRYGAGEAAEEFADFSDLLIGQRLADLMLGHQPDRIIQRRDLAIVEVRRGLIDVSQRRHLEEEPVRLVLRGLRTADIGGFKGLYQTQLLVHPAAHADAAVTSSATAVHKGIEAGQLCRVESTHVAGDEAVEG